jgi:hypothetical protein
MASLVDEKSHTLSIGPILARGLAAGHATLLGALYLFLLHAPAQVLVAVSQSLQGGMMTAQGKHPDLNQIEPTLVLAGASFVFALIFALAVFFLFPLVQGGILGQVRDRLESPYQPPKRFGSYGKAFYVRLLGCEGLFALGMAVIMVPVMFLSVAVAYEMAKAMTAVPTEGTPVDPQQINRQLLTHPVMLTTMVIASFLTSAVAVVFWVTSSIVVSEQARVIASWRKALHFCRQNFSAVLAVCLLIVAAGFVTAPFSLAGQLGVVKQLWALVALALVYSALIGYTGVLLGGLVMSLYLARRTPSGRGELDRPVTV